MKTINVSDATYRAIAEEAILPLARAEGLTAHAESIEVRLR